MNLSPSGSRCLQFVNVFCSKKHHSILNCKNIAFLNAGFIVIILPNTPFDVTDAPVNEAWLSVKVIIQIQRSFNLQLFDTLHILVAFVCFGSIVPFNTSTIESTLHSFVSFFNTNKKKSTIPSKYTSVWNVWTDFFHVIQRILQQAALPKVSRWKRTWWGSYCGQPNGLALSSTHEIQHVLFRADCSSALFSTFFLPFYTFLSFILLYFCKHYVTVMYTC